MYNHNIETPLVRSTSKENMCDSQREDDRHDENVEEKQQQPATTASTCTRPSSSPPSQMDGVQKCDRSRARRKTDNHRLHMVLSQRRLLYAGVHQNLFGIQSVADDCQSTRRCRCRCLLLLSLLLLFFDVLVMSVVFSLRVAHVLLAFRTNESGLDVVIIH